MISEIRIGHEVKWDRAVNLVHEADFELLILHAAADRVVPCVMELGGKSAAIIYSNADLEQVVASTKLGIFYNSGQVCSAMSRVLVQACVHDEVVDRLKAMTQNLSIGPGIDNHDVTPLISSAQRLLENTLTRKLMH